MGSLPAILLFAAPLTLAQAPNGVFETMDTTRADRMGFLGSTRGLTPNLDALAKQAVVFERAYAQAPITTVSHATILSGTYPPKWADARMSLGSVYARTDRIAEADTELRAALELEPKHYRANPLLGRPLGLRGRSAEGLPFLQRSAELAPRRTP